MAVIKTDGYGHGAVAIAHEIEELPFLFGFATATAEEAFQLRKAGIKKPILIIGYTFPYAYEQLIKQDISMTVFREDMVDEINQIAEQLGKKSKGSYKNRHCHVKNWSEAK